VTGRWATDDELRHRAGAALCGGVRWVQLRAKDLAGRDLLEAAALLRALTREAGAFLVVNDRVDIALAARADGVHLPEAGMAPLEARRLLGPDAWVARSVHSLEELRATARQGGADAVQFGPVFDTASKRAFGAPLGLVALAEAAGLAHACGLRLLAVGGIDAARAADCLAAGADGVSVIGGIWDAVDGQEAATDLIARTSAN